MGALADCIMEVYALESCLLRAEKLLAAGAQAAAKQAIAMTQLLCVKAMQTVETCGPQGDWRQSPKEICCDSDGDPAPAGKVRSRRIPSL